ncbi:hypothetical protein [Dactylosporangium matsuzakiense]|uniref:hypothetical protein n=1 Tax=Dactylosporangium matsuzakiense TaxID=53360 RepID=UPI0021C43553|nr:hypothetical protein [Dactylosporangium matsuzakiense]UWZ44608.1 hypothetical protein Dmats_45955 [Dactylosporangium matsuzakiense]
MLDAEEEVPYRVPIRTRNQPSGLTELRNAHHNHTLSNICTSRARARYRCGFQLRDRRLRQVGDGYGLRRADTARLDRDGYSSPPRQTLAAMSAGFSSPQQSFAAVIELAELIRWHRPEVTQVEAVGTEQSPKPGRGDEVVATPGRDDFMPGPRAGVVKVNHGLLDSPPARVQHHTHMAIFAQRLRRSRA